MFDFLRSSPVVALGIIAGFGGVLAVAPAAGGEGVAPAPRAAAPATTIVTATASTTVRVAGSSTASAPGGGSPVGAAADTAYFAGGCFWCVETSFEGRPGVCSVVSGYSGGRERNPTYEQVGAGGTGHAESVRIVFDPAVVRYEELLDIFWRTVDPTQANGQFCDKGNQYRSEIFPRNDAQRRAAVASKDALARAGTLPGPVVTAITPFSAFYEAEEYHQDFWKKDPDRYYSYRAGCGRDRRLRQLWGDQAVTADRH